MGDVYRQESGSRVILQVLCLLFTVEFCMIRVSRGSLVPPAPSLPSTYFPIYSMTPRLNQVCLVQLLRSSRCDIRPVWVASQHCGEAPAPTGARRYAEDPFERVFSCSSSMPKSMTSVCPCTWVILTSESVAVASKRLPVKGYTHNKVSAMLAEYMWSPPALDFFGTATNKGLGNTVGL